MQRFDRFPISMCVAMLVCGVAQAHPDVPAEATTPLTDATRVAAGSGHACAIARTRMACWGDNVYHQLGYGMPIEHSTANDVNALAAVRSIDAGGSHSCAVTDAGAALCWGYNYFGQLGNGDNRDRDWPTPVEGLAAGIGEIAAGANHSCARTGAGAVLCWGQNGFGQLGDGSDTNRLVPVAVGGLGSGVTAIAAGFEHTCALVEDTVKCWGNNDYGQLGDGTQTERHAPVTVSGLAGVTAIAAGGGHTCAVAGGLVKCWGSNDYGQLGDGTQTERHAPVTVGGLTGVTAIAAGGDQTCALQAGAAWCWGANGYGQLGDGSVLDRFVPVAVSGLSSGVGAIATGDGYACAVVGASGNVRCWGANWVGQLGDGSFDEHHAPVVVLRSEIVFADGFDDLP